MHRSRPFRAALLGLLGVAAASCSDSTAPADTRPPSALTFLQLKVSSPPLLANSITFAACEGQQAEGQLFFDDGSGHEGEEFARLKLDSHSLLAHPDGTPFAPGECIDITMSKDPASTDIMVQLEPSGLKFDSSHPAELRLDYGEAEDVDPIVLARVGIWRQEKPSDPFVLIGSAIQTDLLKFRANLTGFSRYALAY
ncbi:MAG TPA: hypothetical protein VFS33_00780 [Gemmatimonadales bacterium]|nr:hypothetical protein [Gemmatimonadales bacterium]